MPWFLVFVFSLTCGFFTILYTFSFGYDRSVEWLFALLSAFITDVFIIKPISIIVVAALFSFVLKRSDMEQIELTVVTDKEEKLSSKQLEHRRKVIDKLKQQDLYKPPPQVGVVITN